MLSSNGRIIFSLVFAGKGAKAPIANASKRPKTRIRMTVILSLLNKNAKKLIKFFMISPLPKLWHRVLVGNQSDKKIYVDKLQYVHEIQNKF